MQKWKILEEQDVSPSKKWFRVYKHKVQLANNDVVDDFYIGDLGDVVSVLAITKRKEIVFVKQYRHAVGKVLIELPAGIVENNLSFESTAIKELKEETGIETQEDKLISLGLSYPIPHKLKMTLRGFLVKDVEFNSSQEFDRLEDIEVLAIPANEVIDMAKTGKFLQPDTNTFLFKAYFLFPELFN